jgi:hypothetical protein
MSLSRELVGLRHLRDGYLYKPTKRDLDGTLGKNDLSHCSGAL